MGPSTACSGATAEQMQCFEQARTKNGDALEAQCKGVDLELLQKEEVRKNPLVVVAGSIIYSEISYKGHSERG